MGLLVALSPVAAVLAMSAGMQIITPSMSFSRRSRCWSALALPWGTGRACGGGQSLQVLVKWTRWAYTRRILVGIGAVVVQSLEEGFVAVVYGAEDEALAAPDVSRLHDSLRPLSLR